MDRKNKLISEEELLVAVNSSNKNIFLGKGFNLCLDINISYKFDLPLIN